MNCPAPTNVKEVCIPPFDFLSILEISLLCSLLPPASATVGFHANLSFVRSFDSSVQKKPLFPGALSHSLEETLLLELALKSMAHHTFFTPSFRFRISFIDKVKPFEF